MHEPGCNITGKIEKMLERSCNVHEVTNKLPRLVSYWMCPSMGGFERVNTGRKMNKGSKTGFRLSPSNAYPIQRSIAQ